MQANNIGLYLLSLSRERIEVRVSVTQESSIEPQVFAFNLLSLQTERSDVRVATSAQLISNPRK